MTKFLKTNEPITVIAIFVAALLSLTALNTSTVIANDEDSENNVSESNKIMALESIWSDKLAEGDLNWIIDIHATDAIQFPPDAGMIQGKEALKAAWEGMINTEGLEISWKSTAAFVSASNDMAYDYGTIKVKNPDSSVADGKYVIVWIRENGEWKVALDMFNFDGKATQ
jgi:ketosteroid isomerase-like protein